jgi:hypothetical protein
MTYYIAHILVVLSSYRHNHAHKASYTIYIRLLLLMCSHTDIIMIIRHLILSCVSVIYYISYIFKPFFKVVWVGGGMGLRVGFININDMYNNDVGKGVVYAYEAYEAK